MYICTGLFFWWRSDIGQSSDDSEAERQKEEEEGKAEEDKNKKEPSKGNLTPSGRSRHADPTKKGSAAAPRKRLGSPSDASGTDTSRKKGKSKHPSSQPTPQPPSRPMSPSASSLPVRFKFVKLHLFRLLTRPRSAKSVFGMC